LMDFGDVVIHIFLEALREYYDLENLWAEAPRVKVPSEFYGPAASRLN
jgi:ribosome-associated protein